MKSAGEVEMEALEYNFNAFKVQVNRLVTYNVLFVEKE